MTSMDRRRMIVASDAGTGSSGQATAQEHGAPEVTRANWRGGPQTKWAVHNVDEIIPVAPVCAGSDPRTDFPIGQADFSSFSLKLGDRPALNLQTWLAATDTDALVILKEGRLVYEVYDNGTTRTTPHIFMSSTKAVMGLVLGILAHEGVVEMDAPAQQYVPELSETGYRGATLRELIDMRAGVVPSADEAAMNTAAASLIPVTPGRPIPTLRGGLLMLTTAQKPHGGAFAYISENTEVVGWAIERATGRKISDVIHETLWAPLGAQVDGYIGVDREGSAWCAGGFNATARDFAMIGDLVLNDGRRGARQIAPAALIRDLSVGGDREAWTNGQWGKLFAPISPNMSYRSGWYTIHGDPELLFTMGVHGQNLFIDREHDIVIAKLSSWPTREDPLRTGLTHFAIPELRRCILQTVS